MGEWGRSGGARRRPPMRIEATAYCGCGRCCGWEWGVSLGSIPYYVGVRPNRGLAWRKRVFTEDERRIQSGYAKSRMTVDTLVEHAKGLAVGSVLGLVLGTSIFLGYHQFRSTPPSSKSDKFGYSASLVPKSQPKIQLIGSGLKTASIVGCAVGSFVGAKYMPVKRFWSSTSLKGKPYMGTTATGTMPTEPVPPIYHWRSLLKPWKIPIRLLTLQLGSQPGTVAADTSHFPFGTTMYIPGYGIGRVEDRGGDILARGRKSVWALQVVFNLTKCSVAGMTGRPKMGLEKNVKQVPAVVALVVPTGPTRMDLFYRKHHDALEWGRQNVRVEFR